MMAGELLNSILSEVRRPDDLLIHPPREVLSDLDVAMKTSSRVAARVKIDRKLGENYAEVACRQPTANQSATK